MDQKSAIIWTSFAKKLWPRKFWNGPIWSHCLLSSDFISLFSCMRYLAMKRLPSQVLKIFLNEWMTSLQGCLQFGVQFYCKATRPSGVRRNAVWPDVKIKCCPMFIRSCPKSRHTCLYFKSDIFKVANEVTKYLGYSCYKISILDTTKIAKSGHTEETCLTRRQ